jgi:ABC-type multidrug transport system ATPase subunit
MLAARGISVAYPGGERALDEVSIDVPRGAVFGLLGPNGAGKSTLLRVLATLQRPDAGTVTLAGIDAIAEPEQAREHLGFLPQEFGFPTALTPLELLDHFALLKGFRRAPERRDAVHAMLQRLNLWDVRTRVVKALSGGMKQRLGLAVSLIGGPDVLIVDEPTVALDPAERHRVHDLLVELADTRAVLLSTHLVADVEALCHSAMILHRGRVVRAGAPKDLRMALEGRVFRAQLSRSHAAGVRARHRVVREFLVAGAIEMTVIADVSPDGRFHAAAPTLDDVFAEATS